MIKNKFNFVLCVTSWKTHDLLMHKFTSKADMPIPIQSFTRFDILSVEQVGNYKMKHKSLPADWL